MSQQIADFFLAIGYVLKIIFVFLFLVVSWTLTAIWLVGFALVFALFWIVGMKVVIKQGDKRVGYVRWTKFYRD